MGGTHLNFFIVKQLPVLPPSTYTPALLDQIVPRVLELTYTAWDMRPFARDLGYDGPPFRWDDARRATLRADLDAIYAHLYGLSRDEFAYILTTFPVLRNNEVRRHGEYRTERLCLAAYDHWQGHRALLPSTSVPVAPPVRLEPVRERTIPRAVAEQQDTYGAAVPPTLSLVPELAPPPSRMAKSEASRSAGAIRYRQAAVVAWLAGKAQLDPNFGRTKMVKELYFLQHHLGADLDLEFVREAAGPLDPAVYKVESLAKRQGWLEIRNLRNGFVSYRLGSKSVHAADIARGALGTLLPRGRSAPLPIPTVQHAPDRAVGQQSIRSGIRFGPASYLLLVAMSSTKSCAGRETNQDSTNARLSE